MSRASSLLLVRVCSAWVGVGTKDCVDLCAFLPDNQTRNPNRLDKAKMIAIPSCSRQFLFWSEALHFPSPPRPSERCQSAVAPAFSANSKNLDHFDAKTSLSFSSLVNIYLPTCPRGLRTPMAMKLGITSAQRPSRPSLSCQQPISSLLDSCKNFFLSAKMEYKT